MLQNLFIFPLSFWVVVLLLISGCSCALTKIREGSGIPMFAVLGTITFWYVGDALYNDYETSYTVLFASEALSQAWWQVAWFVVVFLALSPALHRHFNRVHLEGGSGVMRLFHLGVENVFLQRQLKLLFTGSVMIWFALLVVALIRLETRFPYYLFPFLGYKAEPWGRGRIGSGFDALLSFAMYVQLLVTAIFGVVAALVKDRRIRTLAVICCLFTWPYFVFDRTRNTMLAAVIPGILSWALLRVRGSMLKKGLILGSFFLVVNAWMTFVIANRSSMSIVTAFQEKGFTFKSESGKRHDGLNMYEELCWVNTFIADGSYTPNWGQRYFAEAVNVIPRSLWTAKPLIGIDYSIARGQAAGDRGQAGVWATISTGMIGQGVVNFGRFLGPAAAALLMSLWVVVLARLDLQILKLGRLPLFACGLILTFNLGRDITLITLYPFVFGVIALWGTDHYHRTVRHSARATRGTPFTVARTSARGKCRDSCSVAPQRKTLIARFQAHQHSVLMRHKHD